MMPGNRHTADDDHTRRRAVILQRQGVPIVVIAHRLGVARQTIDRWLADARAAATQPTCDVNGD